LSGTSSRPGVRADVPRRARSLWRACRRAPVRKELLMFDLIMLAIGLGFFALSVGYTIACDRL